MYQHTFFLVRSHLSLSGAENRIQDGWVGSTNASSVQCRPPHQHTFNRAMLADTFNLGRMRLICYLENLLILPGQVKAKQA